MTMRRKDLMSALVSTGFWLDGGVPGVVGRSARFEAIVQGLESILSAYAREDGAEFVAFPPVVDRETLRRADYMESFPELCGSVHSYRKKKGGHLDLIDRVEERGDWSEFLEQQPITLCPAACYPIYPTCAGTLPSGGRLFDLTSYVFRAEPSDDPVRLQSFRQHENVRLGDAESVVDWRRGWLLRVQTIFQTLALEVEIAVASDPFFGRAGRMLAANQIADELKFEVVIPITSDEKPTAITSLNLHEDKFARAFGIETEDGETAHSGCIGFGLERIALAMLVAHGFDVTAWPASVREAMSL